MGQEGIDLHRECRHVIHHDLPWNPAILEQRTGRVDRLGSKIERLRATTARDSTLDIAVPYLASTYDEHIFEVVHGRARLFDVTMGGEYRVDGPLDRSNKPDVEDYAGEETDEALVPLPEAIAESLRIRLEAEE